MLKAPVRSADHTQVNQREPLCSTRDRSESGFTMLEMVVAVTTLALTLMILAYGMYGAMHVLQVAKEKTSFLELANGVVENMRGLDYDTVGVDTTTPDPNFTAAYPGGLFETRAPVVAPAGAPAAVTIVTTSAIAGLPAPYTIRRWVTWTDDSGGSPAAATCLDVQPLCFKRLDVRIEWVDRTTPKNVRYTSMYYPGNQGPPVPAAGSLPTADFAVTGGVCRLPVTPQLVTAQAPCTPTGSENVTTFTFTATATDPNGLPLAYNWNFGDCDISPGTCQTNAGTTVTHQYADQGAYEVVLAVANNATPQGSVIVSRNVLVGNAQPAPPCFSPQPASACNETPTARFTHSYARVDTSNPPDGILDLPNAPYTVSVDASESSDPDVLDDPDGDPLIYTWDWGDGTPAGSGLAPSHTYADAGSYPLRLTVTDPGGLTNTTDAATLPCRPIVCPPTTPTDTTTNRGLLVSLGGQDCTIKAGSAFFKNKSTNTTNNDIDILGNGRIKEESFFLEVKTNAACTGVTFDIPKSPGTFTSTLVEVGISAGVRTWQLTTNVAAGTTFNSGTQSATARATGLGPNASQVVSFVAG